MATEVEPRDVAGMNPCDVVAGMSHDDSFTLRGKHYVVRAGCWTMGGHPKGGDFVQVPVWSPVNGRASTVMVRDRDKLSDVSRKRW